MTVSSVNYYLLTSFKDRYNEMHLTKASHDIQGLYQDFIKCHTLLERADTSRLIAGYLMFIPPSTTKVVMKKSMMHLP